MAAYNFQTRFIPLIQLGVKTGSIRPIGKRRHSKPGEPMQLYTGMRTKSCKKIINDPTCLSVDPISLDFRRTNPSILMNGKWELLQDWFARADGFESVDEMEFFFVRLYGNLREDMLHIKWDPPQVGISQRVFGEASQ